METLGFLSIVLVFVFYASASGLGLRQDSNTQERSSNLKSGATNVQLKDDVDYVLRKLINKLRKKQLISDFETKNRRNEPQKGKRKQGLGEGHVFDHPENIPADSELENILEAEVIENGRHSHQAQGTKPEKKKKLQGDNEEEQLTIGDDDQKRNFITDTDKYWTKGIVPFSIDPDFDGAKVAFIYEAISQFDTLTCVRWVPREDPRNTYENLGHTVYVKIMNGSGCSSQVGMVAHFLSKYNYEYQPLNLKVPGCMSVGTAIHEMMHTLGAQHEQSRSDRDDYVDILYQNIIESKVGNFKNQIKTTDVHPYDGSSVLQYSLRAFSSNGGQTIRFKNQALEFLANIGENLMFYDVKDVTTAYKCAEGCPVKNCQNAGFVNFECNCYCPDLLTGPFCEQTIGSCGGIIDVSAGEEVYITTPNYPNNYDAGLQCTWLIQGEPNNILRGTIVDMEINNNNQACYHWMEIRFNLLGQVGPKRCGKSSHEEWDASTDEYMNKMIINFDSFVGSDEPTSRGFKMKFESIGTGCVSQPCQFGSCYSPVNTDTYVCSCDTAFTGINCTELTDTAVVGCTFEFGEYCILKQDEESDDFDFDYSSQTTPTPYTGPKNAKEGYVYSYTEANEPRQPGDKAVLYTDIQLPSVDRCLRFFYHMYGRDMGTLNVYKSDNTGVETTIFSQTGNLGDQWNEAAIFIPAIDGLKIKFEGIVGQSRKSDLALDDVWLVPGKCTIDKTSIQSMTCDFEDNENGCLFENVIDNNIDVFDWTRQTGSTSSSSTGPDNAYSGQYYMYTEASYPRVLGDSAVLHTYRYQLPGSSFCLEFAYHMYGSPGSIVVSAGERDGTMNEVGSFSGNQGDQWQTTQITIPQYSDIVIQIKGTIGSNTKGDVAVDDIKLNLGKCDPCQTSPCQNNAQCTPNIADGTFTCECTSGFTGQLCDLLDKSSSMTFMCDFEDNEDGCVLINSNDDVFDWTRFHGKTFSSYTGPDDAFSGFYYMYIETSTGSVGDNAILDTSAFKLPENSPFCLQYAYHMYGNPGDLIVRAGERGTTLTVVESFSGNQENTWHSSTVQVPSYPDTVISIEATRGIDSQGDIGVDFVRLQKGLCTDSCGSFPCFNGGECTNDGISYSCFCKSGFLGNQCEILDKSHENEVTCKFEDELEECVFEETDNDVFDWRRKKGATGSSGTGPSQAFEGAYYKYTEASSPRVEGDYAILDTANYKFAGSPLCLEFAYHMFGSPGSLIISAGERNGNLNDIFTLTGNQGDQWVTTSVDIPAYNDIKISIKSTRGPNSKGDTAIDDLRLTVGTCTPV